MYALYPLAQKSLGFVRHNTPTIVLSCALSTTLILGACAPKDKSKNTINAAKIEKIATRVVGDAEAEKALAGLYLQNSGLGIFKWGARTGKSGNYTYSDVTIKRENADKTSVDEVEVWGVHMEDGQAIFDKIEFRGLTAIDNKETMKLGKITLVKPSPAFVAGLAKAFGGDDKAFDNITGDFGFQAMSFADMEFKSKDANMMLKSMVMGQAKDKTGVFTIQGLTLDGLEDGKSLKASIGSIAVSGVNIQKYEGLASQIMNSGGEDVSEEVTGKIMSSMNIYDPDFTDMSFKDLNVDVAGMIIKLESYVANAVKKDGKVKMTQKMSPLSIIPPKDSKDKDIKEFAETLSIMGYDRLEFSMGGTSLLDEAEDRMSTSDTYIEMRDGFRLSYDFDITGYSEFVKKATTMQANGATNNPMAAMGMMSALNFEKFRIAFRDDSIVDRSFKLAAKKKGVTSDALKTELKEKVSALSMGAKDETQQRLADEFISAFTSLIDNSGMFVIDMSPENSVNFGTIMMGAMMGGQPDIKSMGLTISTQ